MSEFVRMIVDDSGVTTVEYALVSATLSVAMIGALTTIASLCSTRLGNTSTRLTGLGSAPP